MIRMQDFLRHGWRVAACLLLPVLAQAQVTPDWVSRNANVYGDMIALDRDNNAYVAGSVPFSTMLVTKLSPSGATLWQKTFDNPGTRQQSTWVAVDSAGNAIVTGTVVTGDGSNPNGMVVLKFGPAGNLLWQDVLPSAFAYTQRVATDRADNVYVLGRAWVTNASGNTTQDIVTTKYASDGTRLWQRYFGLDNTSVDSPASMVVTPAGNVIVSGGTSGNMLLAAYDGAGNRIWSRNIAASTAAMDVAVGPAGEFYAVGGTYTRATGNVFLVVKHDANFNEVWRKTYQVGHYGLRVAVDSAGSVIVTGVTGLYLDWMTIKLDGNGNLLWSRRFDQHQYNDEIPYFLVLGPDNAAYITGQGGPGPASGNLSDLRTVVVKYAGDGTQVWAASSFDSVRGLGVRLGSDNGLFVLGESPWTVFHYQQTGAANQPPLALAAATTATSGPAPLSVTFSSAASSDPDGSIVSWKWDFGDGTGSTQANPTHSYAAGQYSATLTVTDNRGAAATSAAIPISANAVLPTPTSLTLGAGSVSGGSSIDATVTVSGPAGVVVTLGSSDARVAKLPASVTIPAGSTSATFTVRTSRVKADTTVTLGASANGSIQSATLTVLKR